MTSFESFFTTATGIPAPYPYQQRLAEGGWPDALDVPTGLGKTAAVTLAWLYRRRQLGEADMPRRLVWCLPMRVLVEQTADCIRQWLERLDLLGRPGDGRVSVQLLMGGEDDVRTAEWAQHPEEDAILIGTQDMLLSRALMRGYGMSRYQWPVHYALLHNDALWVYDEVQLMGPGLATTAQLEAFRRANALGRPARSLWASATLHPDWLATVDFRYHLDDLHIARLDDADLAQESVRRRRSAVKHLQQAKTCLDSDSRKGKAAVYLQTLAEEVIVTHLAGEQTLVILNRVDRAQALYQALGKFGVDTERLLLHGRFRPAERRWIERQLRQPCGETGRIVIATQAVEAGVDISSRVLFTELAPWASLVQRFGRCNRAGEHDQADIRWIDITDDADEALPYDPVSLAAARSLLQEQGQAGPAHLPAVQGGPGLYQVLRRRDFLELFNTDPDLSGFDVDISPYIRDTGTPQCQVFWRDVVPDAQPTPELATPARDELCPVGISQLKDHLGQKVTIAAWVWDGLAERWTAIRREQVRPGQTLMLCAAQGGYQADQGFVPRAKGGVDPVPPDDAAPEGYGDDRPTQIGRWVGLTEHLTDVAEDACRIGERLGLPGEDTHALTEAGRWHDVGKAHEAFQTALGEGPSEGGPWAKSDGRGRLHYRVAAEGGQSQSRPCFRHELASMLAWLVHGESSPDKDLIAYLIAAHHGRVRLGLRALPTEKVPRDERLFARGVWDGDVLPPVHLGVQTVQETLLRLDLMRLGTGPLGPSWAERTRRLLAEEGPFRLSWLEALVRIADWRASRREAES
ncbi:CRISPR-associated helicase Cas3' [Halomonas sp. 25-S5]|uniref:type I-G CRISPR-associated helicase/endonuclease Cas3g n=1 Tax=Halomonas sp. 25-S5 TaxID=2994065 RepID=UPI00246929E6|nr:CRISPR-associated helicase Cas3' [Halomonas sp. 25-S5]